MEFEKFQLCRVCTIESAVMMSIFGEDALWETITKIASVNIEEGDFLPQQVCLTCAKNAVNALQFKIKCEESDKYFRMQLLKENGQFDHISLVSSSDRMDDIICVDDMENDGDDEDEDEYVITIDDDCNDHVKLPTKMNESIDLLSNCIEDEYGTSSTTLTAQSTASTKINDLSLMTENKNYTPSVTNNHQCHICFQTFSMNRLLEEHKELVHSNCERTYKCFECKNDYISQIFLEKHIRKGCTNKRKSLRPIKCKACNKVFPSGHYLGWHKRTSSCQDTTINLIPAVKATYRKRGRRIKLDANKIELAKHLIAHNSSVSVLATELNISKTFAWRFRNKLMPTVNLERQEKQIREQHIQQQIQQQIEKVPKIKIITTANLLENSSTSKKVAKQCSKTITTSDLVEKCTSNLLVHSSQNELPELQKSIVLRNDLRYKQEVRNLNESQLNAWQLHDWVSNGFPLEKKRNAKSEERQLREKIIQEEILSLLKENHKLQYRKISEILTKKGLQVSASYVCQKLRKIGYYRRNSSLSKEQLPINLSS